MIIGRGTPVPLLVSAPQIPHGNFNVSNKSYILTALEISLHRFTVVTILREPFGKFVDWRQCVAVMQREAVTYAKL
jgi:hypothetical protein